MAKKTKQSVVSAEPEQVVDEVKNDQLDAPINTEDPPIVQEENTDELMFAELIGKIQNFTVELKSIMTIVKTLQKENVKLRKIVDKRKSKRKNADPNAPSKKSGFAVEVKISNELADFLKEEHGVMISRNEVTKRLNAYIKENNLYTEHDKRVIKPDAVLVKLFKVDEDAHVSFFQIQKFMKDHFESKAKPLVEAECS